MKTVRFLATTTFEGTTYRRGDTAVVHNKTAEIFQRSGTAEIPGEPDALPSDPRRHEGRPPGTQYRG